MNYTLCIESHYVELTVSILELHYVELTVSILESHYVELTVNIPDTYVYHINHAIAQLAMIRLWS